MKHENDRTPGDYDLVEAAKELAGYTLRITSNEKNFPKRYRLSVVNKIQDMAVDILSCLIMAKELYPNTKMDYEQRLLYQKTALVKVRAMMTLIEVAANTFYVIAGTFEHWTGMAREVRNHTTAWIISDRKRFQRYEQS